MHRLRTIALVATVVVALAAGTALAVTPPAGTYKGKTAQKKYKKRKVQITTNAAGRVTSFDIDWRAKCKKPKKYWFGGTNFHNEAGLPQNGDQFSDAGNYTSTTSNGKFTGIITVSLKGHFPDANHAQGKFTAKVKVRNNAKNKQVDSCSVKTKYKATKTP